MITPLDIQEIAAETCKGIFLKLTAKGIEHEDAIALIEPLEDRLRELMEAELLGEESQ